MLSEETTTWNQDDLHLGERFDDLVFDSTGGVFPFEAQGSYMGEPFYFRYRWSEASLSYGVEKENVYFYPKHKARAFHEESPDGFLTHRPISSRDSQDLVQLVVNLVTPLHEP